MLRGIVLCEFSGIVSQAFRNHEIECWSCDLEPTEGDSRWHIRGDALSVAYEGEWDFAVMHPPCTHTATSGNRSRQKKVEDGRERAALEFVLQLSQAPIHYKCLEQPMSISRRVLGRATQRVYANWFGHTTKKTFDLWLWNLPALRMTKWMRDSWPNVHYESSGVNQARNRSRSFKGMAEAMASQWVPHMLQPQNMKTPVRFGTRP